LKSPYGFSIVNQLTHLSFQSYEALESANPALSENERIAVRTTVFEVSPYIGIRAPEPSIMLPAGVASSTWWNDLADKISENGGTTAMQYLRI